MELIVMVVAIFVFLLVSSWRKSYVIESASDTELMDELKERSFARKMKAEASAEVENAVNRQHIPF